VTQRGESCIRSERRAGRLALTTGIRWAAFWARWRARAPQPPRPWEACRCRWRAALLAKRALVPPQLRAATSAGTCIAVCCTACLSCADRLLRSALVCSACLQLHLECSHGRISKHRKFGGGQSRENIVRNTSRFTYFVLFLITVIASWIFRDQSTPELCAATNQIVCKNLRCPDDEQSAVCMSRAFVLRMAFATAIFHICLALCTWGVNDYSNPRHYVHTGLWPIKIVLWLVLHLVVFFVPSAFFLSFGWVAFAFGVIFELVQIVIFIEIAFGLNKEWIEEDGSSERLGQGHMKILALSFLCIIAAIGQTVLSFMFFGTNNRTGETDGCELYQFFSSFTLIAYVFLTIFSFRATEWMHDTGLLPSAMVAAFMSFKTLSALYSQVTCNKIAQETAASTTVYTPPQVISGISVSIAVFIAGWASLTVGREMREDGAFWGPSATSNGAGRDAPLVDMAAVSPNQMHIDVEGDGAQAKEPALSGELGRKPTASTRL
jgi:hypothetical protein